ncbi:MAG: hypothetical protein EXR69_00945 [Myxococcales bacterium]|nr:hypothetical protein [Myxococcales bacterium]
MEDRRLLIAALDRLRAGGVLVAEVLTSRTDWLEQTGSRTAPASGETVSWTVRAWRAGGALGLGVAPTSGEAIALALARSAVAGPDPYAGPSERQDIRTAGLGTSDRRYGTIEAADRVELLDLAERAFEKTKENIRLVRLRYRQERTRRSWASTRGTEASETNTRFTIEGEVETGQQSRVTQILESRHFSDVASLPFGTDLRRRAEPLSRALDGAPPALPMIVEPRALAELMRALAPAFVAGHTGFIANAPAGKGGTIRLAPPVLHVTDDAGLHSGLYTVAFDDRGVTPVPLTLLREGVLGARYHTPESARAVGSCATGHVRDGVLRPSNLVIRPGARTRNMIHVELGDLLLLDGPPPLDLQAGRLVGPARVVRVAAGETVGFHDVVFDVGISEFFGGITEFAADQERHNGVDTPTGVWDRLRLG